METLCCLKSPCPPQSSNLKVWSNDGLSLAASEGFSEVEAEAGGKEDGDHNQVLET